MEDVDEDRQEEEHDGEEEEQADQGMLAHVEQVVVDLVEGVGQQHQGHAHADWVMEAISNERQNYGFLQGNTAFVWLYFVEKTR